MSLMCESLISSAVSPLPAALVSTSYINYTDPVANIYCTGFLMAVIMLDFSDGSQQMTSPQYSEDPDTLLTSYATLECCPDDNKWHQSCVDFSPYIQDDTIACVATVPDGPTTTTVPDGPTTTTVPDGPTTTTVPDGPTTTTVHHFTTTTRRVTQAPYTGGVSYKNMVTTSILMIMGMYL